MLEPATTHRVGRLSIDLPPQATLDEFSASIGSIHLEELDLGGSSSDEQHLGWLQLTEGLRLEAPFEEHLEGGWRATYGEPPSLLRLSEAQGKALVLRGPAKDHALADLLEAALLDDPSTASSPFWLRWSQLDLPMKHPEEYAGSFSGQGWELTVGAASVAVPVAPGFARLAKDIAPLDELAGHQVSSRILTLDGLEGEEILVCSERQCTATWRFQGQRGEPGTPEIEIEFSADLDSRLALPLWNSTLFGLKMTRA